MQTLLSPKTASTLKRLIAALGIVAFISSSIVAGIAFVRSEADAASKLRTEEVRAIVERIDERTGRMEPMMDRLQRQQDDILQRVARLEGKLEER